MQKITWVLGLMVLAASACGGGNEGDSYTGGMTSAALGALPVFNAVEGLTRLPALNGDGTRSAEGADITDDYIRNFFKLECHMPDQQNDCPEGIEATADNKYTVTTLIGLIYHAEMKMKDVFRASYPSCGVGDGAGTITPSASSFVSDEGTGGTYVIDFFDLLGCVGHMDTPATSYFAYGTSTDKFVMVDTRKHDLATAGWDQSDIWQVYLSKDADVADHVLAFNSVNINDAANDFTGRAVLLVNLQTRRFLVQYRSQGIQYVTAAGRGGLNASGAYEEGFYFVKTPTTPAGVCVDNTTRMETDVTDCSDEAATWASAANAAAYLGMTGTERADVAGFLTFFASGPTAENLPGSAAPDAVGDAVDMPDRIE